MKHTSKQRPSNRGGRTDLKNQENEQAASRMARRAPRVFHNSYTRAGRRFVTDGWVIKLQHQGRRYTFSLRAATKSAATTEARAIFDTLRMEGWDAALSSYASRRKNEIVFPKTDVN